MNLFRRVTEKYLESGIIGLLVALFQRIPGVRALCVYYVNRLSFAKLQNINSPSVSIRIMLLKRDADIIDLLMIGNKPDIFRERFQMNHSCFVCYVLDEPVAYLWCQQGPGIHIEQRYNFAIPITKNQIYCYDGYTHPEWRRKGLLGYLLKEAAMYSEREYNKNEITAFVEISNLVSQKATEKLGFRKDRIECFIDMIGKHYQFKLFTYRQYRNQP